MCLPFFIINPSFYPLYDSQGKHMGLPLRKISEKLS